MSNTNLKKMQAMIELFRPYLQSNSEINFKKYFIQNYSFFSKSKPKNISDIINFIQISELKMSDTEVITFLMKNLERLSRTNFISFMGMYQELIKTINIDEFKYLMQHHFASFNYTNKFKLKQNIHFLLNESEFPFSKTIIKAIILKNPDTIFKFKTTGFNIFLLFLKKEGIPPQVIEELIQANDYNLLSYHDVTQFKKVFKHLREKPLKFTTPELISLMKSNISSFTRFDLKRFTSLIKMVTPYFSSTKALKLHILRGFSAFVKIDPLNFEELVSFLMSQRMALKQQDIETLLDRGLTGFVEVDKFNLEKIITILEHYLDTPAIKNIILQSFTGLARTTPAQLNKLISFLKENYHFTHDDIANMFKSNSYGYSLGDVDSLKALIKVLQDELAVNDAEITTALKQSLYKFTLTNASEIKIIITATKITTQGKNELKRIFTDHLYSTVTTYRSNQQQVAAPVRSCVEKVTPFLSL